MSCQRISFFFLSNPKVKVFVTRKEYCIPKSTLVSNNFPKRREKYGETKNISQFLHHRQDVCKKKFFSTNC